MKKMIQYKSAFSLMEMMVVLLIISIVAAATAPMISKKLARNAEQSDNPWVYPNLGNSVAFNMRGDNNTNAVIGAVNTPNQNDANHSRLYIQSDGENNHPLIAFGTNGVDRALKLIADLRDYDSTNNQGARVGISDANIPAGTVALGTNQTFDDNARGGVNIGFGSQIGGNNSIAIGGGEVGVYKVSGVCALQPNGTSHTAFSGMQFISDSKAGAEKIAKDFWMARPEVYDVEYITAYGSKKTASAQGDYSIAIGAGANANYKNSVAIGAGAEASADNQIVLGTSSNTVSIPGSLRLDGLTSTSGTKYVEYSSTGSKVTLGSSTDTVYIPGNLVVDGDVELAKSAGKTVQIRIPERGQVFGTLHSDDAGGYGISIKWSDRRLKNVGEKFKGGLEELKKLDLYHYTFKKDKDKTPHVGVMAQDLQKVFPNAVTEGEDGYLRIRWDEMFYAVINAVKELDTKITAVVEQVKAYTDKVNKLEETITAQQETIKEQQKAISELKKNNADFEKRLAKLEKNLK